MKQYSQLANLLSFFKTPFVYHVNFTLYIYDKAGFAPGISCSNINLKVVMVHVSIM